MPVLFNVPSSSGGGGGNSAVLQRTLLKDNWVGENAPYTMTIPIKGITKSSIIELVIPSNVSEAVVDTYTDAQIMSGIQNSDEITIIAYGDKPQIDLPLTIIVRNELVADVNPEETGASEFAKYALKTQISNRNLLDNPWFTVNQRGNTTYTTNGEYTVDRWKLVNPLGSASVVKIENGVRLTTVTNDGIKQMIPKEFLEIGKDYTISAIVNNVLMKGTFTWDGLELKSSYDLDEGLKYKIEIEESAYAVYPVTQDSGSARTDEVKAVKLELGNISTLMMDVIPEYKEELRKCLTSNADSTDAHANKPVTLTSNPNLLDNPWFTVNQRGIATLSNAGYFVDRWQMLIDIGLVNVLDNGIELDATNNPITIRQCNTNLSKHLLSIPKTITIDMTILSSVDSSCQIFTEANVTSGYSETLKSYGLISNKNNIGNRYLFSFTMDNEPRTYSELTRYNPVWFYIPLGWKIILHAIKLEAGSISTLALDTPPNYAEELYKCMTSTADPTDTYSNQPNLLPDLKKSVSDGKTLVANAITGKGVTTATDATFSVMASNIDAIESGGLGELPLPITTFTATVQNTVVDLAWTLPTDSLRSGVEIWYSKTNSFGDTPSGTKCYDSNTWNGTTVTSCSYDFVDYETDFYATIYSYAYINNQRCYTKGKTIQFHTKQVKGFTKILTSGTFTVPAGVTSVDVFLVGGGSKGNTGSAVYTGSSGGNYSYYKYSGGSGGNGGKILTELNYKVTPLSDISVEIGASNGGNTIFGTLESDSGEVKAYGGNGAVVQDNTSYIRTAAGVGGDGVYAFDDETFDGIKYGAGGGGSGAGYSTSGVGVNNWSNHLASANGGTTGGGNGADKTSYYDGEVSATNGTSNTGAGGGGGMGSGVIPSVSTAKNGGSGGSGICIIRWGY